MICLSSAESQSHLIQIAASIALFFDKNNKRFNDFTSRKFYEINIQDLILKIVNLLSKNRDCSDILLQCQFFSDLFSYLNSFAFVKKNDMRSENTDRKSVRSGKAKDYIQYITDKKKRSLNLDVIKKLCHSILSSTCNIIKNIFNNYDEEDQMFDHFSIVVL